MDCVGENLSKTPNTWDFKRDHRYIPILEHVDSKTGMNYIDIWKNEFPSLRIEDARVWFAENDKYGKPNCYSMSCVGLISPTNARYLYHASLILQHAHSLGLESVKFLEIGGGYGGLALFLHRLAPYFNVRIEEYIDFDLKCASVLCKRYLHRHGISIECKHSPKSFIIDSEDWFLISNYAFSELCSDVRKEYEQCVIPHCNNGFLIWNHHELYDFTTVPIRSEPERPQTGGIISNNKFIYF